MGLLVLLVIFDYSLQAQNDTLPIYRVLDRNSGMGLPNALFQSRENPTLYKYIGDKDGFVILGPGPSGIFDVFCDGYYPGLLDLASKQHIIELSPLNISLGTAIVKAYERKANWISQSQEIATVPPHLLKAGDQTNIQNAVNFIPGVDMNSRGYGGSRRFSIRGSLVRSPFGVRGVRFYRNGFPLTNPDGSTSLEMIDAEELSAIAVIKAPAGGMYGATQGGVVLMESHTPIYLKKSIQAEGMMGAYGQFRSKISANVGDKKWALRVSAIDQRTDGYREQERNQKSHFIADHQSELSENVHLYSYFTHFTGQWALPGALTADEMHDNPRAATPFAKANNTLVDRTHNYLGAGIDTKGKKLNNSTRVYFHHTDKENPYGTSAFNSGYKVESSIGTGIRSVFNYTLAKKDSSGMELLFGTELQWEDWDIDEFEISEGISGATKYQLGAFNSNVGFFAEWQWTFHSLRINAGAAYQQADFNAEGYSSVLDQPLNERFKFRNQVAPGLRFLWRASEKWSVAASHSRGFNHPGFFELVDVSTGFLNRNLAPETASASEFGIKYDMTGMRFSASVFRMDYFDLILGSQDEAERISYDNLGRSQNKGAEFMGSFRLLKAKNKLPLDILADVSASANRFIYRKQDDEAMEPLAGIAPHTLMGAIRFVVWDMLTLTATNQWRDATLLNNNQQDYAPSYNFVVLHADFKQNIGPWEIRLYGGINNLTDAMYTSFYNLNNNFGRYFNPSPGRNFYSGAGLGYSFN